MSIIRFTALFTLAIFFLPVAVSGEKQKRKAEIVLEGHKSSITAIAISPTEKWAASVEAGSNDVHLWAMPAGKKVKVLDVGKRTIFKTIEFSPDGKELTVAVDASILQWNLANLGPPKETKLSTEEDNVVSAIAYSRDGTMLATAVGERLLILDRKSNQVKHQYPVNDQGFCRVLFSSDSKSVIAALGGDWTLKIWKLDSKEPDATLKGHRFFVTGLALVNDDKTLVSTGWDQKVIFWDLKTRKITKTFETKEKISNMSFSEKSGTLAVATYGDGVHLFDTKRIELVKVLVPEAPVSSVALAPDGQYLMLGFGHWLPSRDKRIGKIAIIKLNDGQK